jgi:hypothetical protein
MAMTAGAFLMQRQGFFFKLVVRGCCGVSAEFVFVSERFGDVRDVDMLKFRNFR